MKRQLGLCMAYFKSSKIQPLLHQKPWTFSKPSLFSDFFFLPDVFSSFSLHFWWFFTVSQHHPGGLFKNKARIWINILLSPCPAPFAIFCISAAFSQAVPAADATCPLHPAALLCLYSCKYPAQEKQWFPLEFNFLCSAWHVFHNLFSLPGQQ